ncbi:MAG: DNA repair protein RecN [Gammaproteobacteria bacterium 39-13]|nr:DNA repair protein RecN [Gammaproteobacteria bacterium]OJV91388.1 MAG: DNA repair protein RecN [Gammaproteobacteria bacterium 39-13]
MLQHLYIKDLAVVELLDITFSAGMTVITGETGAGKSILLDALNLALGGRSDSHLVRPGAEKAEIAVMFDIASLPGAILWLADLELTCDESTQQCIIRRILYANGRSKAFINGRPATTQQLRLLGEHLLQIHGQHQHQQLLKSHEQLRLLDAFGQHDGLVSQVRTAFKAWEKLHHYWQTLLAGASPEQSRIDLLHYQIAEIEALALNEHELAQLYQEHDQLAYAASYIQATEQTLALLENQEEGNALQLVSLALSSLQKLSEKFSTLTNAHECLSNAHIQLEEAVSEINHFASGLEVNPARLAEIEYRLERIHDMARKHKVEPEKLFAHFDTLKAQAMHYAHLEENLKQLEQDLALAAEHYQHFATQLSQVRLQTAQKLAQEVTQTIQPLGMPGAVFTVQLVAHDDNSLHLHGNETVVFSVSANPGHAPQPLSKVASGGELSRISLALELLTAKYLATPCLVFDEVDVGISGKIGAIVGKALQHLSQSAQVLCVTHLPQVAACGDHHLQVTKTRHESSTVSEIHTLTGGQRIEEIARMLGGLDVTAQARAHAKQLLKHQEELIAT